MPEEHFYTSEHIDRAAVQRRDDVWVNERLSAESTLFVPVWREKSFVDRAEAEGDTEYRLSGRRDAPPAPDRRLKAVFLRPDEAMPLLDGHRRAVLLGDSGPHTYFALDLSDLCDAAKHRSLAGRGDFVGLRRVGPLLDRFDGGLLAYARGMLRWHQQHTYCGVCGSRTLMLEAGFIRRCTNAECDRQHFPRTDPAIIVLVTHGDRALLGRQDDGAPGWSALAPAADGSAATARDRAHGDRGIATLEELLSACVEMDVQFRVCEMGLKAEAIEAADLREDVSVMISGIVGFLGDMSGSGEMLFI